VARVGSRASKHNKVDRVVLTASKGTSTAVSTRAISSPAMTFRIPVSLQANLAIFDRTCRTLQTSLGATIQRLRS
jgi:hypothetical protein